MIRTRLVGPDHDIPRGEFEGDAEAFFEGVISNGGCDGAILAFEGRELVGWLRFYWYPGQKDLWAAGTWVEPAHRGKSIAQTCWARAMKHFKPKIVTVTTVTKEGRHLVGSIVRWFPKVDFNVRAA